ncbi:hypothetical protein EG329_013972 [Mollisiaceae sp. DMI_Dod_QoI]|nr:hypothetical protein EG329_013972 [Helotiales sp. DMI_Dod_QoI]
MPALTHIAEGCRGRFAAMTLDADPLTSQTHGPIHGEPAISGLSPRWLPPKAEVGTADHAYFAYEVGRLHQPDPIPRVRKMRCFLRRSISWPEATECVERGRRRFSPRDMLKQNQRGSSMWKVLLLPSPLPGFWKEFIYSKQRLRRDRDVDPGSDVPIRSSTTGVETLVAVRKYIVQSDGPDSKLAP